MEEKPNYYAILPATVRYDKRLLPMEKILYAEIGALANKEKYCFASNEYFANLYECSTRMIQKYISHLSELEYILVIVDNKESNRKKRKIYLWGGEL